MSQRNTDPRACGPQALSGMVVKVRLRQIIKKCRPLYAACCYARHPSVLKRDIDTWVYRCMLQARKPDALSVDAANGDGTIVSLTSYGKRLDIVHLTIRSLMRQTVKPDKIVLWLDVETDPKSIPATLRELEQYGLEIRCGCENLKGHKKYFWAFREFADACVITVDDDVMYPADTVETLLAAHKRYPDAVVGRRVHRMVLGSDGLAPYADWQFEWHGDGSPRDDLLATGVGGILYPPHCFGGGVFDLEPIMDTGLGNDDLWLKANEIIDGRAVAWAPCRRIHPYSIVDDGEGSLCITNVAGGGNDASIRAIERALGVSFADCVR